MADHTPGTWAVSGERDSRPLDIVQASTGGLIATLEETFGYGEADEANARLIAAAPELLAALEAAVRRITDDHECLDCGSQRPDGRGGTDHDQDCIVPLLEAAIAKAKGV